MTTQQIINKFITPDSPEHLSTNIMMGIYLGMEYVNDDPYLPKGYFIDSGNRDDLMWIDSDYPEDWQFHENWNWLVPLIQKINQEPVILKSSFLTHYRNLLGSTEDLNYEMMYKDVAECIKIILTNRDGNQTEA
jgi:hypothetical protein